MRICKRDGELVGRPRELPGVDEHGLAVWQKLMIHSSERAQHNGEPQYQAIVRPLREEGFRGATVLRGIWDRPDKSNRTGGLRLARRLP